MLNKELQVFILNILIGYVIQKNKKEKNLNIFKILIFFIFNMKYDF